MNFSWLGLLTELAEVELGERLCWPPSCQGAGSFRTFVKAMGPANITEFKYRFNDPEQCLVLCSVGVSSEDELNVIKFAVEDSTLKTLDLTNDDLAKDHLGHLPSLGENEEMKRVKNELLLRFVFPEWPVTFLDAIHRRNIFRFHRRSQG